MTEKSVAQTKKSKTGTPAALETTTKAKAEKNSPSTTKKNPVQASETQASSDPQFNKLTDLLKEIKAKNVVSPKENSAEITHSNKKTTAPDIAQTQKKAPAAEQKKVEKAAPQNAPKQAKQPEAHKAESQSAQSQAHKAEKVAPQNAPKQAKQPEKIAHKAESQSAQNQAHKAEKAAPQSAPKQAKQPEKAAHKAGPQGAHSQAHKTEKAAPQNAPKQAKQPEKTAKPTEQNKKKAFSQTKPDNNANEKARHQEELEKLNVDVQHIAVKFTEVAEKLEEKAILPLEKAPEYVQVVSLKEFSKPKFENLISSEALLKALLNAGWKAPTPTVQQVLPAALRGSDLMIYQNEGAEDQELLAILPALSRLISEQASRGKENSPCALLCVPNDAAVDKFTEIAQKIASPLGIYTLGVKKEEHALEHLKNSIDILVATPATLDHLLKDKKISLNALTLIAFYALEKECADKNNETRLNKILQQCATEKVQKIFFSAANTPEVRESSFRYLETPEIFWLLEGTRKNIMQQAYAVPSTKKFRLLLAHLHEHNPELALVYANTKTVAEWIAFKLHGNNFRVELLPYEPYPHKKQDLLKNIAEKKVNVIVTTDALAQSLGLKSLTHLYHFDIPEIPDLYMQRMGRLEGVEKAMATAFICEDYGYNMGAVETLLGTPLPLLEPAASWLNFQDNSPYPLEADGRVKHFVSYAASLTKPKEAPQQHKPMSAPTAETPRPTAPMAPAAQAEQPLTFTPMPKPAKESEAVPLRPRTAEQRNNQSFTSGQKEDFRQKPQNSRQTFEDKPKLSFSDKHVRRDEKANDVAEAVRKAAKLAQQKQTSTARMEPPRPASLLQLAANVVNDVLQNTSAAAKESFITSLEKNLPNAAGLLGKFLPGLSRKKKDQ